MADSAPRPDTVSRMFLHRVAQSPDAPAYLTPRAGGGWTTFTWKEVGARVRTLAAGLRALGVKPEERVSILSGTRLDWILADFAILCAAGATTTIYPTSTQDDTAFILENSESVLCFAENDDQVKKVLARKAALPALRNIVTFDGAGSADGFVLTLDELAKKGDAHDQKNPGDFDVAANTPKPDSLATLIYTSGTTGRPKGVVLTHDCWVYEGEAVAALGLLSIDDLQYLWLPLAHSFGKVLEVLQLQVGFATAVDGRIDKLVENLAEIKPTVVAAVPRIFEKVYNKVIGGVVEAGGMKKKIFDWAFKVGREVSARKQRGEDVGSGGFKYAIAHKLVFSKLHARFGGRLRFFISGSAPLSRDLAEFFHAAGITILEGYGLTETSAATFVNRPDNYQFGTVGMPLPGTTVKIAESDGEILLKGRGVMRGYYKLPAETAETLDADGYLHTGDIGEIDSKGFLRITDRKKDLIKTSGGKYVAPQGIEGKMKTISPYVSQMLVHGNNRNFCTALISVDEEAIRKWAKDNGLGEGAPYAELAKNAKVVELIAGHVSELNKGLARYESIKKFALLPADLTLDAGDLTPSLKLKRKVVETKYKAVLDGFYEGAGPAGD